MTVRYFSCGQIYLLTQMFHCWHIFYHIIINKYYRFAIADKIKINWRYTNYAVIAEQVKWDLFINCVNVDIEMYLHMNLTRYQNDEIGFHFERYDIFIIKRIQTEIYRVQSDRVSAGEEAISLNFFLCLHI